jgi:phosphatidylglycerol:prolipoprotein diacylglycerol transferase
LYEALLEGAVLFAILYGLHRKKVSSGVPLFAFLMLYGGFRFLVEFFREPDMHLGLLWGGATMGQLLSVPMFLLGIGGILWRLQQQRKV